MWGYPPQQQYSPPPWWGQQPANNNYVDPAVYQAMIKAGRKEEKRIAKAMKNATETEKAKHKDKIDKPKSKWEKVDIIHIFLAMLVLSPIIGFIISSLILSLEISHVKALAPLLQSTH